MKKIILLILSVLLVGALTFSHLSCTSDDDEAVDTTNVPAGSRQATLNPQTIGSAVAYVEDNFSFCSMNASSQQTTALRTTLNLVEDIGDQVALSGSARGNRTAQAETVLPIQGNCPGNEGSATLTMDQDETTGDFTGTVVINSYCQQISSEGETSQTTINGALNFSGNMDLTTNKLTSLVASTVGNLTLDADGETLVILSMQQASVSVSGSTYTASMDSMSISETTGGITHTFGVNNLSAQVTYEKDQPITLTGSADFVDSIEGAVTISANGLTISDGVVTQGTVTIDGAGGTSIQISPQGTNSFIIQADTDGDGSVDYEPGTMDCSGLDTSSLLDTSSQGG